MSNYAEECKAKLHDKTSRAVRLIQLIGTSLDIGDDTEVRLKVNSDDVVTVEIHRINAKSLDGVVGNRSVLNYVLIISENSVLTAVMM